MRKNQLKYLRTKGIKTKSTSFGIYKMMAAVHEIVSFKEQMKSGGVVSEWCEM